MLEIVYRNTGDLIPYVNNSRTHSSEQIAQVAASITEFGFTNPILLDETGGIIAGHGRLQAANKLAMNEVPTITLMGLSEAQRKAYVIADNKLALNAGWDDDLLKLEMLELEAIGFDLEILGFDESTLFTLMDENDQELGLTPEEKLDNYLNGDTKILRLAYDQEELESLVLMLDKGLQETGATDYSTLVYAMARQSKW